MTDYGDRILVFIVFATGLAGLFGWMTGSFFEPQGVGRYIGWAVLLVVYFLVLLGVWELLKRVDTQVEER